MTKRSRDAAMDMSIGELLDAFDATLQANPVAMTVAASLMPMRRPECNYGAECKRHEPSHFRDFKHSYGIDYWQTIGERIVTYNRDFIQPLLALISEQMPDMTADTVAYVNFCEDNAALFKGWFMAKSLQDKTGFRGARFQTTKTLQDPRPVRFFAEDTVYFYFLAALHKYYAFYMQNENLAGFLNILFLRLEEQNITGEYLFYPREYEAIFGVRFHSRASRAGYYVSQGIGILQDKISLSNTSLNGSIEKTLAHMASVEPMTLATPKYFKKRGGRRKTIKKKKNKKRKTCRTK